jgi:DNA-binding HxlR family transcriptional regulator
MGMYEFLPQIIKHLKEAEKDKFTSSDLIEITGISKQSIINNLSRLVNAGFLMRHEFRLPTKPGRHVEYSVSPYAVDIIKELIK